MRCLPEPAQKVLRAERRSSDLLGALALDEGVKLHDLVAENLSGPLLALLLMASDPAPLVRAKVAAHPACPLAALILLAGDDAAEVQEAALGNEALHPAIAAALVAFLSIRAGGATPDGC